MRHRAKNFIRYALEIGALELLPEGRKLSSRRISPYFFNSGRFEKGTSLSRLASTYSEAIFDFCTPDVIFGPAYKGIPLAIAVSLLSGREVGWSFDRKETKDHGEGGDFVGELLKGKSVAIVDDVMTTGVTCGKAVDFVRAKGGIPACLVIAFDRRERGTETDLSAVEEFQNKYQVPVLAAATLDDLIEVLQESLVSEERLMLPKILKYREEWGA